MLVLLNYVRNSVDVTLGRKQVYKISTVFSWDNIVLLRSSDFLRKISVGFKWVFFFTAEFTRCTRYNTVLVYLFIYLFSLLFSLFIYLFFIFSCQIYR